MFDKLATAAFEAKTITMGAAMSDDDPTRRAIRVWMREVLAMKDWSANEWAKRAGTSPTNITRVLAPTSKIIPSAATISKLARVAGSQPKLNPHSELQAQRAWQVPLVAARVLSGFSPRQLWDYVMSSSAAVQSIAVDGPIDGPALVTDVPTLGMAARGIVPGDRILIEKVHAKDLRPGHVVLFYHDSRAKIGEWQGSLIVFYPSVAGDPEFNPIRTTDIEIYGRVRRLIREL